MNKTLKELDREAEHLRRALSAGGLPAATAHFLHSKLIDVQAAAHRLREASANAAT